MSSLASHDLWRKSLRMLRWSVIMLMALVFLLIAYVFIPALPDPSPGFLPRKGSLRQVSLTRQWTTPNSVLSDVTLTSSSGLQVQLTVNRPRGVAGRRPLVILMGGYVTGRRAAALIRNTHGIVIAAISYPYHGPVAHRDIDFLSNVSAIRHALVDTPSAVLLSLDYLLRQDYVDPKRVELAGVSFGAFLAAIPGALDQRFKRVWLIHGGGDPVAVFDHFTVNKIKFKPLRWLLTHGFALLIQAEYLKPERWVGRISPRPVIVVHARDDSSFPPQSIATLDRALHQPYQIIWLGQEHVGVHSRILIQRIADLITEYIFDRNTE